MRGVRSAIAIAVVTFALAACAPAAVPDGTQSADPASAAAVTLVSVIDGDTISTTVGTVRIIGIDAPELGECGYAEATAMVTSLLAPGDSITLSLPEGQYDQDRHGRILRYVDTAGEVDVGLALLTGGLAVARYDSSDGYPAHPREADYHAATLATVASNGTVTTVACAAAADQARIMAEQEAAEPPSGDLDEWWKQYTSCTKLKTNTVGHPSGPFSRNNPDEAAIYEWFANGTGNNGDGEGDGLACE